MSISDEISALCTYSAITRKGSFEDVFQTILITSGGGEDFPAASEKALKTMALAARLTREAVTSLLDQILNEPAYGAAQENATRSRVTP